MPLKKQPRAEDLPLFAQPLSTSRGFQAATTRAPATQAAILGLAVLATGAAMLMARPNGAQNLPGKERHTGATATATDSQTAESAASNARRSLDYYTHSVRGAMFSPPQAAPVVTPVVVKTPKLKLPVAPPVAVAAVNPFADWLYKGTVHIGDDTMALIENNKTGEGQYVHTGDQFMGAQISEISDQQVTLTNAGKPVLLAKSDAMSVTPLNANADFLKAAPQQQGGPPNGAPAAGGAPTLPPPNASGMVTLPNGRQVPADIATRIQNRLNRNWNGGGGGGFGGGGGGRRGGGGFGGGN